MNPQSRIQSSPTKKQQITFNCFEQVEELMERKKLDLVVFKDDVYDLTEFKHQHPGGDEIIEDYRGFDIEEAFTTKKIHQHSQRAHNMMEDFKIGRINYDSEDYNSNNNNFMQENIMEEEKQMTSNRKKHQEFQDDLDDIDLQRPVLLNQHILDYKGFKIYLNIPVATQIMQITHQQYKQMLDFPTKDGSINYCFTGNYVSDRILHNRWDFGKFQVLFMLLVLIIYGRNQLLVLKSIEMIIVGFMLQSLIDYFIQRILVNSYRKGIQNTYIRLVHFLFFGKHLFLPSQRISTGYSPIILFALFIVEFNIGKYLLSMFFMNMVCMFIGQQLYIIVQEFIHFKFHTSRFHNSHLGVLQALHLEHHYHHHDKNFGIICTLWDRLFKTAAGRQ
uniref:Cytochrome b5-like heme/steroid binding domain-containing protein n=1 Tax=Philasterides dicentrarchi TaxID=282688 RepID=A0A411KVD0_9CILI|nr:cytochrome b5-like heme/steroid binding domain-containing protein [Philasterides dicentrarchi]